MKCFLITDDEGGTIKPVCPPPKKSSQSDLYMRLGLLLGDNARRGGRSRSANRSSHSHDSISSLASLEANTLASSNTSPVSTLTGENHHMIYISLNLYYSIVL